MKKNYLKTYSWKWVCVQHPMILLSGDMSTPRALETVPPWGANDIPGYCHKMYEMLKKLEETPDMKADFDLSAKELLIFLEHEPDGRALMRRLYDEGKLGIVGTDYSQAHYGTARSESALRQIRMGAEVFKKELGIVADTFCHQEMGVFENLPQLLSVFGVKKSAAHRFPFAFEYLELPTLEMVSSHGQLSFVHKETMANWCGLDGTCIPMYMPCVNSDLLADTEGIATIKSVARPEFLDVLPTLPEIRREYPTEPEECKGLYRNGSIIIQVPDMVKIDDEYLRMRRNVGEFWRLSDALDEEMKIVTRMPKIHYYTYWSYAEGGFGEQMFKAYRTCEEKLLAAETMQAIACACGVPLHFDADSAWDKLLTAQHHDINWVDHKELRGRAFQWTQDAEKEAQEFIEKAGKVIEDHLAENSYQKSVSVFNTLPTARTALAKLPVEADAYRVFDETGEIPAQVDDGILVFPAKMEGLGFRSFRIEETEAPQQEFVLKEPYQFENDVMRVTVLPDGRLSSLCSKISGERLNGYGNLLRGKLIFNENEEKWISNENGAKKMLLTKGVLYDKISISGTIEDIPYDMVIRLPHGSQETITFDLDLTFEKHEMGDMVHDESKLNLYWDLAQKPTRILIDEPFGFTEARPDRPLLVANFLAALDEGKGVVFQHCGMPKSWVSGSQLATQMAWGSDIIFNRLAFGWNSMQRYDMRLEGKMHYHYAISIAENGCLADLFAKSNSDITPLVALASGKALPEKTLLSIETSTLVPTAIEEKDGVLTARVFDISGKANCIRFTSDMEYLGKTDTAGTIKDHPEISYPYEILEMKFKP